MFSTKLQILTRMWFAVFIRMWPLDLWHHCCNRRSESKRSEMSGKLVLCEIWNLDLYPNMGYHGIWVICIWNESCMEERWKTITMPTHYVVIYAYGAVSTHFKFEFVLLRHFGSLQDKFRKNIKNNLLTWATIRGLSCMHDGGPYVILQSSLQSAFGLEVIVFGGVYPVMRCLISTPNALFAKSDAISYFLTGSLRLRFSQWFILAPTAGCPGCKSRATTLSRVLIYLDGRYSIIINNVIFCICFKGVRPDMNLSSYIWLILDQMPIRYRRAQSISGRTRCRGIIVLPATGTISETIRWQGQLEISSNEKFWQNCR